MQIAKWAPVLFAAALACAAIWPLVPAKQDVQSVRQDRPVEWAEAQWVPHNSAPKRLGLSPLEQRFAKQFPGQIARFADNRHEWIVRVMDQPTRMLHPALDCFRGMGYQVGPARVRLDRHGEQWRCFRAGGKSKDLNVCERIFDAQGGRWTDASSWYWSALLTGGRQSRGPWWAITQVEAAE